MTELAAPVCQGLGLELVWVEFVKEQGTWFLRLFIDKPGGVTLDDCEQVSQAVGDSLDAADPILHPYRLEVASPGTNRPLRTPADFERFTGQVVEVRLYKALDGRKRIRGTLAGFGADKVSVEVEGVRVDVPVEAVARVNLAGDRGGRA